MEIIEKELTTIYDKRKSFYNKAKVINYYDDKNILVKSQLYSYNTLVCTIQNNIYTLNHNIKEKLLFSNTTLRHIKEYLKQNYGVLYHDIKTKADVIKHENKKKTLK